MKGVGTNEKTMIKLLTKRSDNAIAAIRAAYETKHGNLKDRIKSETSGNFRKLLILMITPPLHRDCKILHTAMKGKGTDEDALIETLVTKNNFEIECIRNEYKRIYGDDLLQKVSSGKLNCFREVTYRRNQWLLPRYPRADPQRSS